MTTSPVFAAVARPRNRRELIIAAAAELFAARGYAHVSMSDVASAVGVGPSALYRHVSGKHDLLYEALERGLRAMDDAARADDPVPGVAAAVLTHRGLGTLWQRESRNLADHARQRLRARLVAAVARLEPDTTTTDGERAGAAELSSWAVACALMSVSFQRIELPTAEYEALLTDIGRRVLDAVPPRTDTSYEPHARDASPRPRSRRDDVFTAATRLFAEHGFAGVHVADIGAAAGISGPSIYHYVPGKRDLLTEIIEQGAARLWQELSAVLATTSTAREALQRLLEAYTSYSFRHRHTVDLLIAETSHLPEAAQRSIHRTQRRYVAEWVRLLGTLHPEMSRAHGRVRVQAAMNVVNDIARTPRLRRDPGAHGHVLAIGRSVLLL